MTVPAVGLDLSTAATGLALPDGTCRTIRGVVAADDPTRRLHELIGMIGSRLAASRPIIAMIEGYGFNSHRIVCNAELGGAVRLWCFDHNIPYLEIAPSTLKKFATGNGKATKDQMVDGARALGATITNDNEADAWWLWCAAQQRYEPHHERPPLTSTLLSLPWPALAWDAA